MWKLKRRRRRALVTLIKVGLRCNFVHSLDISIANADQQFDWFFLKGQLSGGTGISFLSEYSEYNDTLIIKLLLPLCSFSPPSKQQQLHLPLHNHRQQQRIQVICLEMSSIFRYISPQSEISRRNTKQFHTVVYSTFNNRFFYPSIQIC